MKTPTILSLIVISAMYFFATSCKKENKFIGTYTGTLYEIEHVATCCDTVFSAAETLRITEGNDDNTLNITLVDADETATATLNGNNFTINEEQVNSITVIGGSGSLDGKNITLALDSKNPLNNKPFEIRLLFKGTKN